MKRIHVMVPFKDELIFDGDMRLVDTYQDPERIDRGYDVYEVIADRPQDLILMCNDEGCAYAPSEIQGENDGSYFISCWRMICELQEEIINE